MPVTVYSPNQTTATNGLADALQAHLEPKLMPSLRHNLILPTYGVSKRIPNQGFNGTLRVFRADVANTDGVQSLSEGVPPATATEVGRGYVDISLAAYGAVARITDQAKGRDLLDLMELYIQKIGANAALFYDTALRNTVVAGLKTWSTASTNLKYSATYGYFERFGNVTPTTDPAADFTTLVAGSTSAHKLTRLMHLGCITQLKAAKVGKYNGRYVAAIAPQVMHDLRQDTTMVNAWTSVDNRALYKGGTVEADGCVFVEHDNAFRENNTYGTESATGGIFSNLYFGEEAFAVARVSNEKDLGSNPADPNVKVVLGPDSANPLDQWTTMGWKSYWGAGLLVTTAVGDVPHMVNLRTRVTFN